MIWMPDFLNDNLPLVLDYTVAWITFNLVTIHSEDISELSFSKLPLTCY